MAPKTTLSRHLAHQHGMLLILSVISIISLQRQLVTCAGDDDRRHASPSRLAGSMLTGAGASEPADVVETPRANVTSPGGDNKETCEVFADYGKNYLTPVDVVVKNSDDNMACIKARFALSIKVEEEFTLAPRLAPTGTESSTRPAANETIRSILGYLPLEHVLSIEESCPIKEDKASEENGKQSDPHKKSGQVEQPDGEQLEMIVTFSCAKLAFTFKRDTSRIFVSSIRGIVKLDKNLVREFVAARPMFVTSDLDHHFKYDDIIEVPSEAQSKTYILTANFYFTEIEAFRKTTSRDFVQPPDESSKPFSDEPYEPSKRSPTSENSTNSDTPVPPSPT